MTENLVGTYHLQRISSDIASFDPDFPARRPKLHMIEQVHYYIVGGRNFDQNSACSSFLQVQNHFGL